MTTPSTDVAIGISLGSESATLAIAQVTSRDGHGRITSDTVIRPTVIAAEDGERSTPAYGAWVDGELRVGAPAKNASVRHPMRSVACLAPLLSKAHGFDNLVKADVEYEHSSGETMLSSLEDDGEEPVAHSVSEVLTAVVSHVKSLVVEAAGGRPLRSVVVTVPRYVDANAVLLVLQNCEFPESASMQVIYDDCAAALANGITGPTWMPEAHHRGVLVVDCGATATQVSLLSGEGGSLVLKGSNFSTKVCGKKIDQTIAKTLIANFKRKFRMDPGEEGRPYRKLLVVAERVKKTLSSSALASAEVEAYWEGRDLHDSLSRGKFETSLGMEMQFFLQVQALMTRVITDATADDKDFVISHVVLHGGVMGIPAIRAGLKTRVLDVIKETLASKEQQDLLTAEKVEILDTIAGDEAAALGAATEASLVANGGEVITGDDAVEAQVEHGELRRDAITYDIGFWNAAAAPTVDVDGKITNADAKHFQMLFQSGTALPMEMTMEAPVDTTMLLVGLTKGSYIALGDSFNIVNESAKTAALILTVKPSGDVTVVVENQTTGALGDALFKANIF